MGRPGRDQGGHRPRHGGLELPAPDLPLTTLLEGALHPGWAWHFLTSPTISFPNIGPPDQRSLRKINDMFDGSVCWEDLDWIRGRWDGPILAKGVMRAEEAVRAAEHGLDGVIVSNHGGRQLDHLPPTIDVLPGIIDAAGDRLEVLVDSGSAAAATSPPRSPWAPGPSWSAGHTCTGWPPPTRPACATASTSSPVSCA
jgi:hypothetical protein